MTRRSASGSSCSPRLVDPVTSLKRTVTVLRTSALGASARAAPHNGQAATPRSYARLLGLRDAAAELVQDWPGRLHALGAERALEVREHRDAEGGVGLGARDEPVEPAPGGRKLLGGLHPRLGGRGEHPDQACQPFF